MANRVKGQSLIDKVDPKKIDSTSLKKARRLIGEHRNDYLKSTTNHCPVQLDYGTYRLLKEIKSEYNVYYYDAVKESLWIMSTLLHK